MTFTLALLAYLIDHLFGEWPCKHPVMWMGDFVQAFERRFYRNNLLSGALLVTSLLTVTLLISLLLVYLAEQLPAIFALCILAGIASTGLAMNMLHASVNSILSAKNPKQAISYLVSRDTAQMSETDIYKAALETWAENLSDGVVAPLFYLLLFGLPGIAVYKAINTLDSMIGYKTAHYFYFGKVAARLDDVANFLPARITALMIVLLANDRDHAWRCMLQDGNKLESPNAGFPIAALAGALGVALGGDAQYHGQIKHKPTLGVALNAITPSTLTGALALKPRFDMIIFCFLSIGALFT